MNFKLVQLLTLVHVVTAQTLTSKTVSITATGLSSTPTTNNATINSSLINVNDPVYGALNATVWSLIYTYPLYIFANFAGNVLRTVGVNQILHQQGLASPDSPGVIKPNIDTVYSRIVLDLSKQDVVLTVPNITDRYYVYPVYDAFGNTVAEIGTVNKNRPGKYLIRRADDVAQRVGIQLPVEHTYYTNDKRWTKQPEYQGIVNLPTTYGTMLLRLFVLQNTTADLDIIHRYQNATSLTLLNRTSSFAPSPSGNLSSLAPNGSLLGVDSPAKLFNFSAKFVPYNQPITYSDRYRVASILVQAGIYDGHYVPQSGVNLTQASQIANDSIAADLANPAHIRKQSNGWQLSIPSYQGNYSTAYAPRAYVAIAGYQQLTDAQVIYPGYENIGFTSVFTLQPNTSVLVTFSGKPDLDPEGFWSLSIYGADQYLIPNKLNAFEVGDRSYNLTYRSGGKVYGPQANVTKNDPFDVLLQTVNTPPPANWTGNWIPVTSTFSTILRFYTPRAFMTNGTYVYPKIQTVKAIL